MTFFYRNSFNTMCHSTSNLFHIFVSRFPPSSATDCVMSLTCWHRNIPESLPRFEKFYLVSFRWTSFVYVDVCTCFRTLHMYYKKVQNYFTTFREYESTNVVQWKPYNMTNFKIVNKNFSSLSKAKIDNSHCKAGLQDHAKTPQREDKKVHIKTVKSVITEFLNFFS